MKRKARKSMISSVDVAKRVGLSRTTVSYVLNGREDVSIPDATRQRVLSAAAELGYRPNRVARSLVSGKTQTIGVIVPALELSSTADIVSGIELECSPRRYRMLLAYSHNDPDLEIEQARLLLEHRVDAIICVVGYRSVAGSAKWLREAEHEQVPCVIVDSNVPGVSVDYIVGDDRNGAFAAVSHLVRLGHRRIAHLCAGSRSSPARDRRDGYADALTAAGIPLDNDLVPGTSFEPADAAAAMIALMDLPQRPTAVFAADDLMAAAAIDIMRHRGLRVPQDVAIVGFNDITLASYLRLTTVRLSATDRGRLAVERILARIKNPYLPSEGIVVSTQLVVRESCGGSVRSGGLPLRSA